MKVQAKAVGFYGGARHRAGDVFEVKDGTKSSWFEPVETAKQAPAKSAKAKKEEPVALSDLQKEQPVQDREVI
jgi:hypothetical protein